MVNVFRLHIRPKGGLADPATSFGYCLEGQLLGVGWGVETTEGQSPEWQDYLDRAEEKFPGGVPTVRFLRNDVKVGDLIWTRDARGGYYLARVREPWQYLDGGSAGHDADIFNFVRCEFQRVDPADVPGKIIACFRPARTLQRISNPGANRYSRLLWNRLSSNRGEPIDPGVEQDIDLFGLLDDQMTEDVVALYLQAKGWRLIPSTAKSYTMRYEFVMIHGETGEQAVVEVKTGHSPVDLSYGDDYERVFVFQPRSRFVGEQGDGVSILDPEAVAQFVLEHAKSMPGPVRRWVEYLNAAPSAGPTSS